MEIGSTAREEVSLSLVDGGDESLAFYFSRLRLLCSEVISLVQSPKRSGEPLVALAEFVRASPAAHLQSCFDYILVPLLLLLDGAISCRKEVAGLEEKYSLANNVPHMISDNVAERLLFCLQELLRRCHLSCIDQMVMLLTKLASGAILSPLETAEEFRWGIVKCLKVLLLRLSPCSVVSCSCKLAPGLPSLSSDTSFEVQDEHSFSHPVECLISFLQSHDASAIVGHWLSLLLQVGMLLYGINCSFFSTSIVFLSFWISALAETEASRGHHGNAELRSDALLTLRVLIAKVGTADRLAFFLPGVVSRFAKALNISKTMISGAAGSTESMAHVVYGLGELLFMAFGDEVNLHGLGMSLEDLKGSHVKKNQSAQLVLEALRHLPTVSEETNIMKTSTNNFPSTSVLLKTEMQENDKSLFVDRNKDWIAKTSECVDKLLSATFPHLCVNPANKVRLALVSCVYGLLTKCIHTMRKSKSMLLECLYVLVCDDSAAVASAAQEYLEILMLDNKYLEEHEIAKILESLARQLPKVVLGSEDTVALSHAQKLLAAIYYAGPQRVVDHILCSPVTTAQFLDSLSLSLSHSSVFAGSFDKLMLAKASPAGYLQSLAELTYVGHLNSSHSTSNILPIISSIPSPFGTRMGNQTEVVYPEHELPRMPPWFSRFGAQKLYRAVSGILRLISVSLIIDCRDKVLLSSLIEIPLEYLRKLIFELRQKDYRKESWHSWYIGTGSGRLLRQASTAVCVINEIMYGISDQSLSLYIDMFEKSGRKLAGKQWHRKGETAQSIGAERTPSKSTVQQSVSWLSSKRADAMTQAIDCVGNILHEYLSQEIWSLPVNHSSLNKSALENLSFYFFQDTSMLQQVIIDGFGIFSVSLRKDFRRSGFLLDCLYLLLENLICSNDQIKRASDAVLHRLSTSLGHKNVRDLVVKNADYIVDSLCRQLRLLDLNPQVPNVIAAVLSYIGMAHDILPLLDEPMRSVSTELEVLGRHRHPELTISLLKAVREITKASKQESAIISVEIQAHSALVRAGKHDLEKTKTKHADTGMLSDDMNNADVSGRWEDMLFKLNELKTYRRTIGSVAGSCLAVAGPLLASGEDAACLIVLDIVEDGITALEAVEKSYVHEKQAKEEIEQVVHLLSLHGLKDILGASDEGVDENRLLPAMNKLWPYMVVCLKHGKPVAVKRCLRTVSIVVQVCGGDFFIRRLRTDGSFLWKLLTSKTTDSSRSSKNEGPILLPYRKAGFRSTNELTAEVSILKVKEAALHMIADIARDKRSASALEGILKKVSGLVVGIACGGPDALQDAATSALSSLSCIDPDLIWVLLADIVYSSGKGVPSPPTPDFPEVSQLLPSPSSPKEYLFIQYSGEGSFEIQLLKAEKVFEKLNTEVFTFQSV